MLDALWKTPARLVRRSANDNGEPTLIGGREVARGALEDMLKLAAGTTEAEDALLAIDCRVADAPLTWPEIRVLLAEPTFPVDI